MGSKGVYYWGIEGYSIKLAFYMVNRRFGWDLGP
jgi:hypothetical protein